MDDLNINTLNESKNEYTARLVHIMCPHIIDGFRSIFDEAWKICNDNGEVSKYIMTFQNLLTRVPKWNASIIEKERIRIIEKSACNYLEHLITCVHLIQLKILSSIRVSPVSKKIEIKIPDLDTFIHKIYIHAARKIYSNVYLFERNIPPLQVQKNNRELELIVQECIINTVRENMPIENIIRSYMEETHQIDEEEVIVEDIQPDPEELKRIEAAAQASVANGQANSDGGVSFYNQDQTISPTGIKSQVDAPKDISSLEKISEMRSAAAAALEEEEPQFGHDLDRIEIGGDATQDAFSLDDIEELI